MPPYSLPRRKPPRGAAPTPVFPEHLLAARIQCPSAWIRRRRDGHAPGTCAGHARAAGSDPSLVPSSARSSPGRTRQSGMDLMALGKQAFDLSLLYPRVRLKYCQFCPFSANLMGTPDDVTGIPQAAKQGNGKRRCGNRRRNAWRTCHRAACWTGTTHRWRGGPTQVMRLCFLLGISSQNRLEKGWSVAFAVCLVVRLLLCGIISQSAFSSAWLRAGKKLKGLLP